MSRYLLLDGLLVLLPVSTPSISSRVSAAEPHEEPTAEKITSALSKEFPGAERLGAMDVGDLAGMYSRESPQLAKRIGGFLSGSNLYLLPDGRFIYTEWADVAPESVYETGTWKIVGSSLLLDRTEPVSGLRPLCDSVFIPFQLTDEDSGTTAIRAIGQTCNWHEFLSDAKEGDAFFALLMNSLELVEPIEDQRAAEEVLEHLAELERSSSVRPAH